MIQCIKFAASKKDTNSKGILIVLVSSIVVLLSLYSPTYIFLEIKHTHFNAEVKKPN